jgi:VIT1/CCC1 family predicted Fe2+/Mn2+ transporter
MDISRDIGIGIVMIVPTFVGAGLVWQLLGSWIAVFIWIAIMAFFYGRGIYNKYSS